jgi:hypothetical protein
MNDNLNSQDNVAVVHQLLKELDTFLLTLETQIKLEMPSQLELEMVEVALTEEQLPSLEDDLPTDWF